MMTSLGCRASREEESLPDNDTAWEDLMAQVDVTQRLAADLLWAKTAAVNSSSIFQSGPAELESLSASVSWNVTNDAVTNNLVDCMYGMDEDCALWQYDMGNVWPLVRRRAGLLRRGAARLAGRRMGERPHGCDPAAADSAAGRKNNFP
jgi:hypothetical protein